MALARFKTSLCNVLAFSSQLLWEDTKALSSISNILQLVVCTFAKTQRAAHTQTQKGGWFEMIGPPRQRTSGHITFVSLCHFLALIFANVCLRFLPRSRPLETDQDCVSRASEGVFWSQRVKGSCRNLTVHSERRRHLAAVKTHWDTHTHSHRERRAQGFFERRLQVTAHLDSHLSKPCLLWLTRLNHGGIDFTAKMDVARITSVRKPLQR